MEHMECGDTIWFKIKSVLRVKTQELCLPKFAEGQPGCLSPLTITLTISNLKWKTSWGIIFSVVTNHHDIAWGHKRHSKESWIYWDICCTRTREWLIDCLRIHDLTVFSFSVLEKELDLKAYDHSGILLLNLMSPDYKNVWESQEMYSKYTWKCPLILLTVGGQASCYWNSPCSGEMPEMHVLPQSLRPSFPASPAWVLDQRRSIHWDGDSDLHSVALRITVINLKLTWGNVEVHGGIWSHKHE